MHFLKFRRYLKRDNTNTITNAYTNTGAAIYYYKKMLYYNKINFSINQINQKKL